eukprot:COSAG02_NODE_5358_length_4399_cov_16.010930_3_plen_358_part_00
MVSEGDATSNARWRKGMLAFSAFVALLYGPLLIVMGVFELPPFLRPGSTFVARTFFVLIGLLGMTAGPVVLGWWASMHTASCLCRDASIEVVKDVRVTDPKDLEQWEAKVTQPALALREKFELLSDGWSGGLLGATLSLWFISLGSFTLILHPHMDESFRALFLAVVPSATLMPFPLATDIASTSSWCDTLMAELNEARIKHGEASHLKIHCLETSLKQLVRCPYMWNFYPPPCSVPSVSCLSLSRFGAVSEQRPRPRLRARGQRARQAQPQGHVPQARRSSLHGRWLPPRARRRRRYEHYSGRHGVRFDRGAEGDGPLCASGAQRELLLQHDRGERPCRLNCELTRGLNKRCVGDR